MFITWTAQYKQHTFSHGIAKRRSFLPPLPRMLRMQKFYMIQKAV